ncbi:MAG: AmmeMemoRadiSam system protein B [Ignavibacterium album]|uniref:AmmeMemoRadiSam system protein B n=1 Tax=Ignavibacterium album TaxID=591197 RepID=UPI0026EA2715|nr:AmmeMemoRadiSam system protein B [Ignavibacterium album]MCX8104962.1 AmmeMemoRadiSam system protein B [Ignavibacterium album]
MKIRQAHVAGYFYPADPVKLKNDIQRMLDRAKTEKTFNKIVGIVSPHAGYIYSGQTAAYAYETLKGKTYKTVIVISPSHAEYFPGISVYDGDAYETPLGVVEIDQEKANKLVERSKLIFRGIQGHRREHALEVQIPFLQSVLSDFKIVPVVMGDQSSVFVNELAKKLAEIIDDETVIVASSDLSHFYDARTAEILDSVVVKRINDFDYEQLQRDLNSHKCEACGGGPIVSMMKAAALKNYQKAKVLKRTDSGDVTGDKSEVVGYLSAVVYQ